MSEVVRDSGADGVDPDDVPPLAADRPFVDGTAASPEELRAEVNRLSNEERQHVDDLREEVGDSVAALASRFDVKARMVGKRDDAVATVQQQVGRARTAAAEGAVSAKETARRQPGVLAAVAAALLVLVAIVLRRRRG
jgi:transposase-like protein